MIKPLLNMLDSPRRHLAALMALLLATFVLTGVLAWQAHQSEQAKAVAAQETLQEVARTVAATISYRVAELVSGSVPLQQNPAVVAWRRDRDLTVSEFARLSRLASLCHICSPSVAAGSYFAVDLRTHEITWSGAAVDATVPLRIATRVRAGAFAAADDSIGFALFAEESEHAPLVLAYVRRGEQHEAIRLIGAVLDPSVLAQMTRFALAVSPVYPKTAVRGLSNDSLVSVRLYAGTRLLYASAEESGSAMAVDSMPPPVHGLVLQTRVRRAAEQLLFPKGETTVQWALLLTLVAVISGLFVASLMLVRREAELVRMRADFIASASHELRTPLAQIRMFAETLLLGRVRSDVDRRRSLEIIDQEARRLSGLVDNLMAFAKGEGGRNLRLAPEPTAFAEEVRHAAESFAPLLARTGADLRLELQENVMAAVDRNALRQILVNLIDNACKYGPAAQRITVGLAMFDDAARVWVDDEGPGIPVAARERVFESFYRLSRDVEAKVNGSGIGLAVVRQLARLHDGEVWAEAAPGGGARIVVEFPGAYLRAEAANELAAAS